MARSSILRDGVQLITYVDRLSGGGLRQLEEMLEGPFDGLFQGVHLLPFFYPIDGADAGFDPIDHSRVDERLGNWADVRRLSRHTDIAADLIVNHISAASPQFRDFLEKGEESEFAPLFLTLERVFPDGASAEDVARIYRPRPNPPFTTVTLRDNSERVVWTTFTRNQIDIDVRHPKGREYLHGILHRFADAGVRLVRLDAVGYAIKKSGTSCFMIPATFDFIDELTAKAHDLGMEILIEIHSHFRKQIEIAGRVDRVYDFALPPTILHALLRRTPKYLKRWFAISPRNAITVLDTHDGIGVMDIGPDASGAGAPGLINSEEIDWLVETIHSNSGGASRLATGAAASNLDLYQVNCTYFDALDRDETAYLLARLIQFFAPGIPQVYYVGLLAGRNDTELFSSTDVGRDINRHYFSREEIDERLRHPVVKRLFDLIRFCNTHPAFCGAFELLESSAGEIRLKRANGSDWAELLVDFESRRFRVNHSRNGVRYSIGEFGSFCD